MNSASVVVTSDYSNINSEGQVSVLTSSEISSNPTSQTYPVGVNTSEPEAISLLPINSSIHSGSESVTSRKNNNTSVTLLNAGYQCGAASQRMSVFEPYPMRDTVQHFCEKHLEKIKAYMDNVSIRIPPPAKCTIEGIFFNIFLTIQIN